MLSAAPADAARTTGGFVPNHCISLSLLSGTKEKPSGGMEAAATITQVTDDNGKYRSTLKKKKVACTTSTMMQTTYNFVHGL